MAFIKIDTSSASGRNYVAVLLAFIPFVLLICTGVVMLVYHIGKQDTRVIAGLGKADWLMMHKITAIVAFPMVAWHLVLHYSWFVKLVTLKLKNKYKGANLTLFIVYVLSIATAVLSWLVFQDSKVGDGLRGIHSKLGFLLIVFLGFHLKNYLPWIVKMTKKIL